MATTATRNRRLRAHKQPGPFLGSEEAAAQLGATRTTLPRAITAAGLPPAHLVGGRRMRIARRAVERAVNGGSPGDPDPAPVTPEGRPASPRCPFSAGRPGRDKSPLPILAVPTRGA